jgi:hypothetical protein
MRVLIGMILSVLFLGITLQTKGQDEQKDKLIYYYIEDLTVESFSTWVKSTEKTEELSSLYVCIPAKIIGVKSEKAKLLKTKLNSTFTSIKRVELSQLEAEQKCANQRTL